MSRGGGVDRQAGAARAQTEDYTYGPGVWQAGRSMRHWPSEQNERGQALVPSTHRRHGAPSAGQSASLAHIGDGFGRQMPGQSAAPGGQPSSPATHS